MHTRKLIFSLTLQKNLVLFSHSLQSSTNKRSLSKPQVTPSEKNTAGI